MSDPIIFHHIRNATSKLSYSGLNLLIDPFFTPKEYYPGFELGPTLEIKKTRIPLVDLPLPIEDIIKDIDAIFITHLHWDHWDDYTAKYIPKYIPIFVQNAGDKKVIQAQGFSDIRVLGINTPFKGITITKQEDNMVLMKCLQYQLWLKNVELQWDLFLEHQDKKQYILEEIQYGMNMLN